MNKQDVVEFFDRLAPQWDAEMIRSDAKIARILDAAGVREGVQVLDVACGTGVLMPDYLARGVAGVLGVDISQGMIDLARGKFDDARVQFLCADVETAALPRKYDCAVVYNAFPHFPDPAALLESLAAALAPQGRLTIAHGMGRAMLDAHHAGTASRVSNGLMSAQELAALFAPRFAVDTVVDEEEIYIVSGALRA